MANKKNQEMSPGMSHNAIAVGTEIRAEYIKAKEGIRIDGTAYANIECAEGRVVIGPQAYVEGTIECLEIEVSGTFVGDIISKKACHLLATSDVKGTLTFKFIHIEEGAKFQGECKYIETVIKNETIK